MSERYTDRPGRPFGGQPTADHPFVVEVLALGEREWAGNALSFETAVEAGQWGLDLLGRWFAAKAIRVVDTRNGHIVATY